MASFEVIRVYGDRARQGAAGFNARAARAGWLARIVFWLLAVPVALVMLATAAVVVFVVAVVAAARVAVLLIRARLAGVIGTPRVRGSRVGSRDEGRRNVRVIRRTDRAV